MKFETHTLKNGMRVLLAPSTGSESVTVMVMTGTGSRYETKEENGMAHFLEHMLFKGTKNRKSARIIAEEIDAVGGQMNAFTSKDHTAYYAKVDKKHISTALSVISDIFLNPTLPPEEIKRERGAVVEEINMYEDMPMRSVLDDADITLFGANHPLGRTILGPKKNILSFTRKQFTEYFNRNYVASNSALCIAGSFSKTQVLKEAEKLFKNMRVGETPECAPYEEEQHEPRVNIKKKKTDQTHLVISVPSYPFDHANEAAAEVLAAILGGGMSSRLFSEVRERRGLAYYVRAENDVYSDVGSFYMRAGVANISAHDAIAMIVKELKKITKKAVTSQELQKGKEYVKGTFALSLDTTDAQAQFIGYTALVRGKKSGLDAFNKKVDAVTAQQLLKVAKDLFKTENLNLTIIGPHTDEKAFLKLLKV
ncbi:insulinase family protein [Candidatus Kaiserbacteria bacterium]|nr:MAG: insulinase family protein [Candidatus Kaiserbacteria bacterium]